MLPVLLLAVAIVAFPYSVGRIFLETPIEAEMGTAQKIFYFHVPLAWIMMVMALVSGAAATIQLMHGSARGEAVAVAAAEMTVVAGAGVLITGPIWGHATWGTAWTWDARQVTTGLLWFVFVAYLLVRRYGAGGSERLAAALAVFGATDVPIIYYAVKIWKTTHPKTGVVGKLPPELWASLWPALGALMCLCIAIVWVRTQQERARIALDEAWIAWDRAATRTA